MRVTIRGRLMPLSPKPNGQVRGQLIQGNSVRPFYAKDASAIAQLQACAQSGELPWVALECDVYNNEDYETKELRRGFTLRVQSADLATEAAPSLSLAASNGHS